MSATDYDSRTADKFVVRLPDGLRDEVEVLAHFDDRSMNSVIVQAIRNHVAGNKRQELLLSALEASAEAGQAKQSTGIPAVSDSMHIDDRVRMIGDEPACLTVVFKLPSLNHAQPLIAQLPYGQKALGTEAVVFGLSTGNLMEGAPCAD